ncbi:MAG TPA: hypothetical protein VM261_34450 [Kofleriaceae bacterium]|nr:hypothetical protein [Kofleriaceae bacterium]
MVSAGCHGAFDETRQPVDNGTFGETVHTLVCKRIAYLDDLADGGNTDVRGDAVRDMCRLGLAPEATASGKLKALMAERERLAAATDAVFPESYLPTLQTFLTSNEFLALYDNDQAQVSIDALIASLRHIAADDEAVGALERLGHRLGYRPMAPAMGAVRAFVSYPELHDLVLALTQAITPGGGARGEWQNLIEAVAVTLRNAEPAANPGASDRTLRIALDFLLTERAQLGTTMVAPLTTRDVRGVAKLRTIVAPYVDANTDGQADVNDLGQYVDAAGMPIASPAPFELPDGAESTPWMYRDALGRALTADAGPLLYQYVDLDKTVLAALARDGIQLFDPQKGTAFDLTRGASALVGPRMMATRTYANGETLEYRGYDTADSPLLDMSYAYLSILRDPAINDTLALANVLLSTKEPEVAQLVEAIVSAARKGDGHPEAVIPPNAPLWDDLTPVIRQILARPALVRGLLAAMEKPEVAQLGERFRKFMTYKDRFDINAQQQVTGSFATMVDRNAVDNAFNRSLFQRILHVIADSNNAVACNKQDAQVIVGGIPVATYDECDLFRVNNLATFYLQSIAYAKNAGGQYICETDAGEFDSTTTAATPQGCVSQGRRPRPKANFNYNWGAFLNGSIDVLGGDAYIEGQAGIQGMRSHPTPAALNRVLFLNPMPEFLTHVVDPMRDREGDLYQAQHAGTLPVWEVENFYDQIRPIVQAFADDNSEQLFIDVMVVLHKHWATRNSVTHQSVDPNAPGYVFGSGAMTYERLMVDILTDGTLMGALQGTAASLNTVTANGKDYEDIVRVAGTYVLTPRAGLADRQGRTTSMTSDGRAITTLSPWHLLADAYNRKRDRLAQAGAEGEAWTGSVSEVIDVLTRGANVPGSGWRFKNPRTRGVLIAVIGLLQSRIAAHDTAGDRTAWLTTELPGDLEAKLTSPVFAGAADFIVSLQATPETRLQLEKLMQYLVDEASSSESFVTSLTSIADVAQIALDDRDLVPIARVIGECIAPERGWLDAQLVFVKGARESDAERALAQMMVNLYSETQPGRTAVGDLVDGLSEVLRDDPYNSLGARYTGADYRAMLNGVADFLDEEKRGLRKFIQIIKSRNL